jgi:hypothetical protein
MTAQQIAQMVVLVLAVDFAALPERGAAQPAASSPANAGDRARTL